MDWRLLGEIDMEQARKVERLGKRAWPYAFAKNTRLLDLQDMDDLAPGEKAPERRHKVAGRVRAKRASGGIAFLDLEDQDARLQVVLERSELGDDFDRFLGLVSLGDWIGVDGHAMRTKRGAASLGVRKITMLAKCLVPLVDLRSADNPELRYGRPYLNLMQGPDVRKIMVHRHKVTQAVRKTLESAGFIEAAIPVLEKVYGGANAEPFRTHSNAKEMELYLRISHELPLKKLLVGGIERVYHLGPAFRNEDIDTTHNPEFTLMECYAAYWDYRKMMRLTERIVRAAVKAVHGEAVLERDGQEIDLRKPFRVVTMKDAIREQGHDVDMMSDEELESFLAERGIKIRGGYVRGLAIAKMFEAVAEEHLIGPTFVIDHPRETTPLCKPHRRDASLVERFELFIFGREHANSYSELNDPLLQARLLADQDARRAAGDAEAQPTDHDFLEAMKFGMPPAAGLGIGIDRLVMSVIGVDSIKQVLPFPQMK